MIPLVLAGLLAVAALIFVLLPLLGTARTHDEQEPSSRREALEREKEEVYLAIRELEFDHGTGVVSDDDFKRLMPRYRAHALSLLEAIDKIEKGAGAQPGRAAASAPAQSDEADVLPVKCPVCGASNAAGYHFCTRCGHEVPAPGREGDAPLPGKVGG